jgi:hypothetical protein
MFKHWVDEKRNDTTTVLFFSNLLTSQSTGTFPLLVLVSHSKDEWLADQLSDWKILPTRQRLIHVLRIYDQLSYFICQCCLVNWCNNNKEKLWQQHMLICSTLVQNKYLRIYIVVWILKMRVEGDLWAKCPQFMNLVH